ncbi:MAG: cytochrome c [Desulfobacterales bacterium]|nr:cytochrome c [Desulfobacterales bacterium]
MIRRLGSALILLVFLIGAVGLALAAGDGNARKGKYLFRKNCRTCHIDGGSAKPLSPIDKTQAKWDEVFKNIEKLPCKDKWSALSEKDIQDMYAQLWGHAFDSPSPEKCE